MGKIYVKCFGNFEVFYEGTPIHFRYKKTKELIAYLVHREGAQCTLGELLGVLYEDRACSKSLQSQMRNLVADLAHTLKCLGANPIIYRSYGQLAILPWQIDCDYYDKKLDDPRGQNAYAGEYMTQYSWAEETAAYLDQIWVWNEAI